MTNFLQRLRGSNSSSAPSVSVRPLLLEAMQYIGEPGAALDLGAGALIDAGYLAREGFTVVAVDSNPAVQEIAKKNPDVKTVISTFETYEFPAETFDLVTAQFALPYTGPHSFEKVFSKLTRSLKTGGIFTGQFFGTEDGWANKKDMTFHTKEEVTALLKPYRVHVLRETKKTGKTVRGDEKFWHVFNVIAEKV